MQHVSPLGKSRTGSVRLGGSLLEAVEALVHGLRVSEGTDLCARDAGLIVAQVQLDAGDDAASVEEVDHLLAVGIFLEERLRVEYGTADGILVAWAMWWMRLSVGLANSCLSSSRLLQCSAGSIP